MNPQPYLLSRGVEVVSHRPVGSDGSHLQLQVIDPRRNGGGRYAGAIGRPAQAFPAIAFRQGEWAGSMPRYIDMIYRVSVNQWQGNSTLQLVVEDIRPAQQEESVAT